MGPCMQTGGVQERMKPAAVVSLVVYTLGLPAFFFVILVVHRHDIFHDQSLREKHQGNTPMSPYYSVRKRYQELYVPCSPTMSRVVQARLCIAVDWCTSIDIPLCACARAGTPCSALSFTGGGWYSR